MEPTTATAITLAAYIVKYLQEKKSQKSREFADFEGWVQRNNHKELVDRLIDNDLALAQVSRLINDKHERMEQLVATPEQIASLLQEQFAEVDKKKADLKIARDQHRRAVKLKNRLYDVAFLVKALREDVFYADAEYIIRKKIGEERRKLNKAFRRASAEWNESLEDVRRPLIDCLNDILNAYRFCEQAIKAEIPYEHRVQHWDEKYAIAFGDESDKDPTGIRWKQAVKAVEERANKWVFS